MAKEDKISFKEEFRKNMFLGTIIIGICLVAISGYYLHAVKMDYDNECGFCVTEECMNDNIMCGDFGFYKLKIICLIAIGMTGVMFILPIKLKSLDEENGKRR